MSTLPLPEIITRLAGINHCDTTFAEKFLTEFSTLVERTLSTDGTLHIKGIGTFRRIELGDDVTVAFAPDDSLAEAVNAPFAMFEPIELDDEVTGEMLEEAGSGENAYARNASTVSAQEEAHETGESELQEEAATEGGNLNLPEGIPPVPQQKQRPENPGTASETVATDGETGKENENERQPEKREDTKQNKGTAKYNYGEDNGTETEATTPVAVPVTHEKIIEKERVVEVDRSHHTLNLVLTGFIALLAGLLIGYFTYDKLNLNNVKSVNISADDVQVYHQPKEVKPTGQAAETAAEAEIPAESPK